MCGSGQHGVDGGYIFFFFFLRIRLTTNRSKRTTEEIKDDKAWRTATNKLDLIYANYSVMY